MNQHGKLIIFVMFLLAFILIAAIPLPQPQAQSDDPNPPPQPVKLIFIHHSTGENWLMDGYGNLGRRLGQNNYFVSDTNYGWGPNSIGDRTDIPNWIEWFGSSDTPMYMSALFNESGQNSDYTRTLPNPGGENQIVMFKSCFPNSELDGGPNDPPGDYEGMTVGGAKYVYNHLLDYFVTHPDKLFVVITAPPVSNSEYAANARAFNNWLVSDWLHENNYTLNNVAVFDFYNILTDPNAHHRVNNGQIEHIVQESNTLYYPSDDDHPSVAGSQRATEEFIPMLNVFYHRWMESAPLQPAPQSDALPEEVPQSELYPAQPSVAGLIDDFETDNPPGTNGWEPFWDETTPTSMHCNAETGTAYSGGRSLLLDFEVVPGAWATCALFYEGTQNWGNGQGLKFYLYASQPGLVFNVDIYAGNRDAQETYIYTIEAPPESANGWVPISLAWGNFHRADWEENAGAPLAKTDQVVGMAFGFDTYEGTPNTGKLWIDELSLMGTGSIDAPPPAQTPQAVGKPTKSPPSESARRRLLPCGGALALPLGLAGLAYWKRKCARLDA